MKIDIKRAALPSITRNRLNTASSFIDDETLEVDLLLGSFKSKYISFNNRKSAKILRLSRNW